MSVHLQACVVACAFALTSASLNGQSASSASTPRPGYDVEYIGLPLSDPVLQQAKETYVVFGCAYCHGITLTPRGEAADLLRSPLVGADSNGDTIAALLRAGVPRTTKLSPMPQFSDLSDRQLHDIARYIHYARRQRRYEELVAVKTNDGDAATGGAYFAQQCASCHASDLNGIGQRHDASDLRARLLRPASLSGPRSFGVDAMNDAKTATARERHDALLENFGAAEVDNLLAFLRSR
jgi:mono/diheme cytochrome c family protein